MKVLKGFPVEELRDLLTTFDIASLDECTDFRRRLIHDWRKTQAARRTRATEPRAAGNVGEGDAVANAADPRAAYAASLPDPALRVVGDEPASAASARASAPRKRTRRAASESTSAPSALFRGDDFPSAFSGLSQFPGRFFGQCGLCEVLRRWLGRPEAFLRVSRVLAADRRHAREACYLSTSETRVAVMARSSQRSKIVRSVQASMRASSSGLGVS